MKGAEFSEDYQKALKNERKKGTQWVNSAVKLIKNTNPFIAWVLTCGISFILMIIVIILFARIGKIKHESKSLIELTNQRDQFYIEWHSRVAKDNQNEHIKSLYFDYASELIRRHYQKVPSKTQRQMRPDEIYSFLDTIYYYAVSNIFPSAKYPDGLFLPLAFACVETDFYPDVVGLDGERSVFQFMTDTARSVYFQNGKPFVANFWMLPQESVWLWFNYYRQLSSNFICDSKEREIQWTALAYNAGLYRNKILHYFSQGYSVEKYLNHYPYKKGNSAYSRKVYEIFKEYKEGFTILQ